MNQQPSFSQTQVLDRTNTFLRSVYNWMAIGLGLTGFTAYYVANNEAMTKIIYGTPGLTLILFLVLIGFVFFLSARIQKIKASTATALFSMYAILNGVVFSSIFLIYTSSSIFSTFIICSATFLGCSIYGMVTKRDLTSLGSFMFMGLLGIIIASLVNIFIQSSAMQMIISYVGVIVFVGLTAYDTQKLKNMSVTMPADATGAMVRKGAIMGALTLYLDFINLFIMLLHIFGSRR
jgi:uncharacterized protein